MKEFEEKLVSARWLRGVDFTDRLPAGVTITSASVTVEVHPTLSEAADETPEAIIDGAVIHDETKVAVFVHEGVPDCLYVLTFHATLTDGQIDPVQVKLKVVELQP